MSRNLYLRILAFGALLAFAGAPAFTQERPKPPEQKPKPAKKPKKVWTEDDVHAVRKPWHDYQDQAAEAAAAAKAAAEAKAEAANRAAQAPAAEAAATAENKANKVYVPDTVEGIEKQIQVYQTTIASYHQRIADAREKYFNTGNDEHRAELRREIDFLNSEIEKFEADLKVLEASLEKRLAAGEKQPPPAPPLQE